MKIYISGPITGQPNKNRSAFEHATEFLLAQGHIPFNPLTLELFEDYGDDWNKNMRRDLKYLTECDALFLLPGWESSKGATLEVVVAQNLSMNLYRCENNKLVREHVAVDCEVTPLIPSNLWKK